MGNFMGWGAPPKRTGCSWFQQNRHCHLQTLATKGALVLGFPSQQPAAGEPQQNPALVGGGGGGGGRV